MVEPRLGWSRLEALPLSRIGVEISVTLPLNLNPFPKPLTNKLCHARHYITQMSNTDVQPLLMFIWPHSPLHPSQKQITNRNYSSFKLPTEMMYIQPSHSICDFVRGNIIICCHNDPRWQDAEGITAFQRWNTVVLSAICFVLSENEWCNDKINIKIYNRKICKITFI